MHIHKKKMKNYYYQYLILSHLLCFNSDNNINNYKTSNNKNINNNSN